MKFIYEYRTSDNVRHDGVINATNRESAFTALKAKGIKPGRMTEAPGIFNQLAGKGKRWMAIGVLGAIVVALVWGRVQQSSGASSKIFDDTTRRQLIGDATSIEKGTMTGWRDVFANDGDRFLAGFAVPGVPVAVRTVSEKSFKAALLESVSISPGDTIEVRQIKSIVEGMKREIKQLLLDGWTIVEIGNALVDRQEREISYYHRAKREVELAAKNLSQEDLIKLWEQRNAELRQMGIRQVAFPE